MGCVGLVGRLGWWQWEGALGVPGRTPPHLSSLPGEIGGNPDPFKVSLGWGRWLPAPAVLPRGCTAPREGPPSPEPAPCPPVQQLGWHQLRDAGPRGAADAAHHGAGLGAGGQHGGWDPGGLSPLGLLSRQVPIAGQWLLCLGHSTGRLGGPQGCDGAAQPRGHSPVPPNSPGPSLPSNAGSSPNTPRRCAPGEGSLLWGASPGSPHAPIPMGGGKAHLSAVCHPQVPAVSPAHG